MVTHLMGFTEEFDNSLIYGNPDRYPGAIPVQDVRSKLFDWKPVSRPVYIEVDDSMIEVPDRQAIVADDTNDVFGVFKRGYVPHEYNESLVDRVSVLLGGNVHIGAAGTLKNRAVAYVQMEMPETIQLREIGEAVRPYLMAWTSLDGSIATNYGTGSIRMACNNRLTAFSKQATKASFKHTKLSQKRMLSKTAETLKLNVEGLLALEAEEYAANAKMLTEAKVSDQTLTRFLDAYIPAGEPGTRTAAFAQSKRDDIQGLYDNDNMVAPWKGTQWGVLQAVNTYNQHLSIIRGNTPRWDRNLYQVVKGDNATEDLKALSILEAVA